MSNTDTRHINWIDGLKGLSCVLIFVHHFLLAFYPSTYYGNEAVSHTRFDVALSQSPLSSFFNGNFLVCIFCILSGFLISSNVFHKSGHMEQISDSMLKRYFRLALPVFGISLIIFILMQTSLFSNLPVAELTGSPWLATYYTNDISFFDVFTHSFVYVWITTDSLFSTAFWMLTYIFYGSFLSYILCMISYNRNRKILYLFLIPAVFFLYENSLLLCFVFGTGLAYIMTHNSFKLPSIRGLRPALGIICILSGLFLGGYPSYGIPSNIYRYLNILPQRIQANFFTMLPVPCSLSSESACLRHCRICWK